MQQLPDVSIRQLEYLVAVADAPTWATAAATVGVSASALSQGLSELERRVGVELFERHGRLRKLRPQADPVLEHARHVLALTGDLADWAAQVRHGERGRVRIGMIDVAAVGYFPLVLRRFREARRSVDLHLRVAPSATLVEDLAAGEIDLAVCADPRPGPDAPPPYGVALTPLLREPLLVYAPPGVTVTEPAQWGPWVMFPDSSITRATITAALAAAGAPLRVVADSHQPDVLREMVQLGLGWTVLPAPQAETGPRPLADGLPLTDRQLVLLQRSSAVIDPAVDQLAAALTQAATTITSSTAAPPAC